MIAILLTLTRVQVGEQYKEKVTVTEERRARAAAKWH